MWQWLTTNWGWLLAGVLVAGYFAPYVLAIRRQRAGGPAGKSKLPCDRC